MKCILPLSLFLTKWHAFVCVLNLFSVQTDLILFYFFQAGIVQAAQIMFSKLHRAGAERINVSIVTSSHVTERFSCVATFKEMLTMDVCCFFSKRMCILFDAFVEFF